MKKENKKCNMLPLLCIFLLFILSGCGKQEMWELQSENMGEATDISSDEYTAKGADTAKLADGNGADTAKLADGNGAASDYVENKQEASDSLIYVYICGEVNQPGVYEMPAGSRVYEVVNRAGGMTDQAAEYINQAELLSDGQRIIVPAVGDLEKGILPQEAGASLAGASSAGATQEKKININTATREELTSITGIGGSRADSIIAYREENGRFEQPEDIMNVTGIKEGLYGKIKDKITVR